MIRRKLYGWLKRPGEWCLGRQPPDTPSMPHKVFASLNEARLAAEAMRATIIWSGDAARHVERLAMMERPPLPWA
jgi:hypothetical protein